MISLDPIKKALLSVSNNVGHFEALKKKPPYIVWAEDGQSNALWADGRMQRQTITGTVDLFTKEEGEPLIGKIQDALNNGEISWYLNSVQYEQETELIHYEWVWELG